MLVDVLIFGAFLAVLFGFLLVRRNRSPDVAAPLPSNSIVVDGSNVMHWGGEPSAKVLQRVVKSLQSEGFSPFVVFDASVGYRLNDRYMDDTPMADLIGVPVDQVLVVAKGVVADEVILQFATENSLKVVSNDRYRDWSVQFAMVKDYRRFLRGTWQDGSVVWGSKR